MSNTAEWTEDDQARADLVSDLACEISADEDVVSAVLGTLEERGLFNTSTAIMRERIAAAFETAGGDLSFAAPLQFKFAQSSDETGEYYTRMAKFVDARGLVIIDITSEGEDWCDTQMHAVAAILTIARQMLDAPAQPNGLQKAGEP